MLLSYDFKWKVNTTLPPWQDTQTYLKRDEVNAEAFGASTDNITTLNVAPEKTDTSSFRSEERLIGRS